MATLSHTPQVLQRRKRRQTEFHFPYFSGTSRHGAPVRSRHKMPLMMLRLSAGGRPRPRLPGLRSTGNNTRKIRHSPSVRSPRLKAAPRICSLESKRDSRVNDFVHAAYTGDTMQRSFRLATQVGEPSLDHWGFAVHTAMALIVIVLFT